MKAMKVIQKILFTVAMVVGLSLSVSAQKGDEKKPPPKGTPPVVTPGPKNPPPKGNPDKPKKPGFALVVWKSDLADNV